MAELILNNAQPNRRQRMEDLDSDALLGKAALARDSDAAQADVDSEELQQELQDMVLEAHACLVQDLARSEIVELPPGTAYQLGSSAVLLRGSMRVAGSQLAAQGGNSILLCGTFLHGAC